MSGLGNLGRKAADMLNNPKTRDALKSEKAEGVSDSILDTASGLANKVTGNKHADKIDKARDAADKKIGNDDAHGTGERPGTTR
ncbi:antitoxin [Marisediminicola senii]|uniref:antitoxin n=1 Tax=Marisediminicola senii TaxID=2711233 RepID=UPI0013EE39B5|nr:antitoxin [Marisediminicola senii]